MADGRKRGWDLLWAAAITLGQRAPTVRRPEELQKMPAWFSPYQAIVVAALTATLTAFYIYLNSRIAKKAKQKELYRILISELRTLRTHFLLSGQEVLDERREIILRVKMAKYWEKGMIYFDAKELYILNQNLCQDLMQIILCTRNTDLFCDYVIETIQKTPSIEEGIKAELIGRLSERFLWLANVSGRVRENLERHIKNPKRYNEPQIMWAELPGDYK